jgi:hypothetical protein
MNRIIPFPLKENYTEIRERVFVAGSFSPMKEKKKKKKQNLKFILKFFFFFFFSLPHGPTIHATSKYFLMRKQIYIILTEE